MPCYIGQEVASTEYRDGKLWFYDLQNYPHLGIFLEGSSTRDQMTLNKLSTTFTSLGGVLYKRLLDGVQLRCVNEERVKKILEETHGEPVALI